MEDLLYILSIILLRKDYQDLKLNLYIVLPYQVNQKALASLIDIGALGILFISLACASALKLTLIPLPRP